MKKLMFYVLMVGSIVAALTGCQIFHPGEPRLIAPKNGAVFDSLPPTFVWHKEEVSEYYLLVFKDSLWSKDTLLWDTLADTTFAMSKSVFASADSGTYKWTVAVMDTTSGGLLHPAHRSFRIKFGDTPPPPIDLDTTYFPFGLGYEWCYEYNNHGYESYEEFNIYDTITISVIDSFWDRDTLKFKLNGIFEDLPEVISIFDNRITLSLNYLDFELTQPILLSSQEELKGFISYNDDTMKIRMDDGSEASMSFNWVKTSRIKGIGAVCKGHGNEYYPDPYSGNDSHDYRLLYFYNGKDTVYKAKDWGEVIEVDLDTTYFPLGLNYEWIYQRHIWGNKQSGDSTITWDDYDTFMVSVADSLWEGNTMLIRFASDSSKPFHDLGNPAKIIDGKIFVQMWSGITPWVNPYEPETRWGSEISYYGDTLRTFFSDTPPGENPYYSWYDEWVKRLRDIGPILQGTHYWNYGIEESYINDSLIRFTTPEGQIWP